MKKFGFTLAEVLITLGIIGVVAALTAPALVTSSRNEANAARLSVTVSNLENALTSAIVQEGVDDLFHTRMWENGTGGADWADRNAFIGNLGRYLTIASSGANGGDIYERATGNNQIRLLNADGSAGLEAENQAAVSTMFYTVMKNGAVVFWTTAQAESNQATEDQIRARGGSLIDYAGLVIIDVNGTSAPNTVGRDIFRFAIGGNGFLYPCGGSDYAAMWPDTHSIWSEQGGEDSCLDGAIAGGGWGCTARVIEEGYKINY